MVMQFLSSAQIEVFNKKSFDELILRNYLYSGHRVHPSRLERWIEMGVILMTSNKYHLYKIKNKHRHECSLLSPTDIIDCEKKMKSPLNTERILITKLRHPIRDNKKLTKAR